jgi:hypothetical protein
MKRFFFPVLLIAAAACNGPATTTEQGAENASLAYFGDTITEDNAMDAVLLDSVMKDKDRMTVKVAGTISEVCQRKGCWMNVDLGKGQTMTVRFKDYGFFVPKDAAGKTVLIDGEAFHDTVSVADLQHYAEDAGKTQEEIATITEPEVSLSFEARGVIIK